MCAELQVDGTAQPRERDHRMIMSNACPNALYLVYRMDENGRVVHVLDVDDRSEIYHRPQG